MRLFRVWVAIAAIASFRQVMLVQMPATYATPANRSATEEQGKQFKVKSQKLKVKNNSEIARSRNSPTSSRQVLIASLKGEKVVTATPKLAAKKLAAKESFSLKPSTNRSDRHLTEHGAAALKTRAIAQLDSQDETPRGIEIPINRDRQPAPDSKPATEPATPPTVPVQPAPGTESLPQQETPNRIQVPVTPNGAPAPGSVPNQPNPPIPPSTPAPEQKLPTDALPPTPTQPGTPGETQPTPTQPGTPAPNQPTPETQPEAAEPRVLVAEVAVSSETGTLTEELQNEVYQAIRTAPGRTTTRSQLQEDINAIFATGFFANVRAIPEDTPLGVRVAYIVQPNPTLQRVQIEANPGTNVPSVLPPKLVEDTFKPQYGNILNFRRLQEGIKQLNEWYQKNGYVLAQVIAAPQVAPDGTVTLQVSEGVVEDIQVRFVREGEATDDEGKPIRGRTRDFIITRELALKPNNVFNRNVVQSDLQRVYGLGIFEDVNVALNPGQDPRKVIVVLNVDERRSGSLGLSGGISSASGLFGAVSFQQNNLGGNNQKLGAELQVGTERSELLFDLRFTDPWIAGDPYRTSYTVNLFQRRSISLIFDGDDENIEVGDPDDGVRPRVRRQGGGVTFTRPLSRNPLARSEWTASAGLQYQRISIRDDDGEVTPEGRFNGREDIPLSFSDDGSDDLLTVQLGAVRDLRNNITTPTDGSFLRLGVEQSIPIGSGSILLNRLRGSYSQYIPVNFTSFNEGPETLAFNIQAGTVIGDLPPYEAFSIGGSNSVRGYGEGELGSGRSFVTATAEYRFPIFSVVGGALFVDFGSDLGTAGNVPGEPAILLDKPGTGVGYGVGVRVNSPLGPLRLDYGLNSDGDSRIQFGIGEKF
ncbi:MULTISPECIES: BamA/TamA family outer membrane protein [Chroococcidiopsis]|uniref:Beta-barrel assembly machine subunit BamA n=1 Tax=Chroococcidiopsis thermalis (strain PCC 7203) TaxID=251229 RepID=K9TYX5_CHRTP|nr:MULTISPECIES: BamA/TamA family outer membrane protein [Chroococcidiopsis]AFY87760.1 Beta-barrel assembly machine subunit BamA [Chroococcidiopsis thermalis PCC 7203]URD52669.1 BamA/TamA family outer membrane protein [Chroococcidiopsis sp. CCNUC1]